MKVLHINTNDCRGGAAIAAFRLHEALLDEGIHSRMLVGKKYSSLTTIAEIPSYRLKKYFRFFSNSLSSHLGLNYANILDTFQLSNHPFLQEADILHFHNLHGGYFNYLALPFLTKKKPAVITLHDMWAITGHCAHSLSCEKWESGCGNCPYRNIYPKISLDLSAIEWRLKSWAFKKANVHIITPSLWLKELVEKSFLKTKVCFHIPHFLDDAVFYPRDRKLCRQLLNLPQDKSIILLGAESFNSVFKGVELLPKILKELEPLYQQLLILTIGNHPPESSTITNIPFRNFGYIEDDHLKSVLYSSADLFLIPSIAENAPLIILENMACGTPAAGFKIGGISESVRNDETGINRPFNDDQQLGRDMHQLLLNKNLLKSLSKNASKFVKEVHGWENIQKQIKLYQERLNLS
ncbi:glycosyltransferase [Oligoflexia bacterium]|nr:glycosyltransferase [Oligoflexia bacterium]